MGEATSQLFRAVRETVDRVIEPLCAERDELQRRLARVTQELDAANTIIDTIDNHFLQSISSNHNGLYSTDTDEPRS